MGGLLDHLSATPAMAACWDDRARLDGMLRFEAALAAAQAELGIVPDAAVAPIAAACRAELYDPAALGPEAGRAGNLAIPLVRALTRRVAEIDAEAARSVHWGATSQDAQDTGTVLQIGRGSELLLETLDALRGSLREHARAEADTLMVGRTWMQHALPVTFGLKAAGWLGAAGAARRAVAEAAEAARTLQFGGAAGTLASLGGNGGRLAAALAGRLGLRCPPMPWHTDRTRILAVGAALGTACAVAGKIARDLALLGQTDVAEAFEPGGDGRGGSSTMPHKRNPVGCAVALQAAAEAPGFVATLFGAAAIQEHERGMGGWHAEWEALPALFRRAHAGTAAMAAAMAGLRIDRERMRHNLDATRGLILAEAASMALAEHVGKEAAHRALTRASAVAAESGRALSAVLREDEAVAGPLGVERLEAIMRPEHYLGMTREFIDAALAADAAI